MKAWKCKNGRVQYSLPNCKICGKRSNTTDKETARDSHKYGRVCRACTQKGLVVAPETKKAEGYIQKGSLVEKGSSNKKVKAVKIQEELIENKSIWQKIKEWFYD